MSLKSRLLGKLMSNAASSGFCSNLLAFIYLAKTASDRYPVVHNCRDYTSNIYIRYLLNLLVLPAGICKYFFHGDISRENRDGLAIVLIAKNEADYIQEWLDFHIKQGVSNFVIYDNESDDNLREVLQPYIDSGIVLYELMRGHVRQIDAYNKAFWKYGRRFKYMAVIDADEFLFVRDNNANLYDFVDRFMNAHDNAGGLVVNWCMFGSSGHVSKPLGGVLRNFTRRAPDDFAANHAVKSICDPLRVLAWNYPHQPKYLRNFDSLDENASVVKTVGTEKVSFEKIRINHYFSKSWEEFLRKKSRGFADSLRERDVQDFYANDRNEILDTEILSHV